MPKLVDNLRSLGTKKLAAAGIAFLLTAAVISSLAYFATRPDMTVLYAGMEPAEAGQVVGALESMGIQVQPGAGGTSVSVPRGDVDRARMTLAERGLPNSPGIGYELFDKADGFGLTTFMQRVNRLRAMEGELARTVATLSGVDGARVHLVLPDRESFSRTAPDPTASVVIRMKNRQALEITQARAVRHLIASAVPGLKPDAVTITDADGQTLLADGDGAAGAGNDRRSSLEARYQRSVEEILSARLGAGNVRVGVTVEIETAREITRSQSFDPEGRVIRSTQTVEDKQQSSEGGTEQPTTVQQNLPNADLLTGPEGAPASTLSDRLEETVNYEISNQTTERVLEPGDIRKVSVAVLVNGEYSESEEGETYSDRSAAEIESLERLVKTAVGFNEERGDLVSVQNLQFAKIDDIGTDTTRTVTEILAENAGQITMWLLIAVISGLIMLFVVRPLVASLTNTTTTVDPVEPVSLDPVAEAEPAVQVNIGGNTNVSTAANREALLVGLHEAVDENPDEAVSVLRAWIQEGSL